MSFISKLLSTNKRIRYWKVDYIANRLSFEYIIDFYQILWSIPPSVDKPSKRPVSLQFQTSICTPAASFPLKIERYFIDYDFKPWLGYDKFGHIRLTRGLDYWENSRLKPMLVYKDFLMSGLEIFVN